MKSIVSNKHETFKIPIFAYHNIVDDDGVPIHQNSHSPFSISRIQFYNQMRFLAENHYRTIDFPQLLKLLADPPALQFNPSGRMILLTFDDGWRDNYDTAFPVLKEFGLTATFFIISSRINDDRYMSWARLKVLQNAGMQIESHTHSHIPLALLSEGEIKRELQRSKMMIEGYLEKPVRFLSFPHGSYNKRIMQIAKQLKYNSCATSDIQYADVNSNLYRLPRIVMRKTDSFEFFNAVCRTKRWIMRRARFKYGVKNLIKETIGLRNYMFLHGLLYRTGSQAFHITREIKN